MRVSFVQYGVLYPFHIGGPGVVAYNLLREFDKDDVRVNFFLFWNGPFLENADLGLSPNVKIHVIGYRPIPSVRALVNFLRSFDPIVHFNTVGARPPHPLLPLLCRLFGRTVVCSVHGYRAIELRSNKMHKWPWSWIVNAEFRLLLHTADRLIVFSDYMQTLVSRHVPVNRIEVIPLGVNLRAYAAQKRTLRKSDETFQIICVARLVPVKGLETLVKAMGIVQRKTEVHTYIVGVGPLRSKLQVLIDETGLTDKFKLCGFLPDKKKRAYLENSDLFVLPSLFEPIPIAILEGLAAGLPVVASDVGGIPELVRPGVNGLLVKPGNPHDLAAAISKLIDDDKLRRKLASNARQSVRNYDWSVVAKKYLSFYQELLSN
jgi:glycosyltransferase involved in cell wall biosynthesis